jgi:hypothetical protein
MMRILKILLPLLLVIVVLAGCGTTDLPLDKVLVGHWADGEDNAVIFLPGRAFMTNIKVIVPAGTYSVEPIDDDVIAITTTDGFSTTDPTVYCEFAPDRGSFTIYSDKALKDKLAGPLTRVDDEIEQWCRE